jgi:3-oxoacyl-[acyl-carrier protein] reductase
MTPLRSNSNGAREIAHVATGLSKHGEPRRLTGSWTKELAGFGLDAVAAPGPITTEFFRRSSSADDIQQLKAFAVAGRCGTPGDAAHETMFLLSSASSFMTRQVMGVCDGASFGSAPW